MRDDPQYVFEESGAREAPGPPPRLPPPRWRAPRPRGCLTNVALVGLGLFGLGAAWCCISGGLIDSVLRESIVEAIEAEQRANQPSYTLDPGMPFEPSRGGPPPGVVIEQGLRQDAPSAGPPPEVVPDQGEGPSFRPGRPVQQPKKQGAPTEEDIFGVQ